MLYVKKISIFLTFCSKVGKNRFVLFLNWIRNCCVFWRKSLAKTISITLLHGIIKSKVKTVTNQHLGVRRVASLQPAIGRRSLCKMQVASSIPSSVDSTSSTMTPCSTIVLAFLSKLWILTTWFFNGSPNPNLHGYLIDAFYTGGRG